MSAEEYCNSLNQSTVDDLNEWNSQWSQTLIPFQVYYAILMGLGIVGNTLVLYIYYQKSPKNTAIQFILCLGTIDLFVCLVVIPMSFAEIYFQVTFFSHSACLAYEYMRHVSIVTSYIVLDCVAVDRYLVICKPMSFLLHTNRAKYMICLSILSGCLIEIPVLFMYGVTLYTLPDGLVGCVCDWEVRDSSRELVLQVFLMLVQLSLAIDVSVLYIQVYYTVRQREKTRQRMSQQLATFTRAAGDRGEQQHVCNCSQVDQPSNNASRQAPRGNNGVGSAESHNSGPGDSAEVENPVGRRRYHGEPPERTARHVTRDTRVHPEGRSVTMDKSTAMRLQSLRTRRNRYKTVKMLVLVTVVYYIAWLPYWHLMFYTYFNPDFYKGKADWELNLLLVLRHLYFVNNAVNPIIYTATSKQFRADIGVLISRLKSKFKQCFRIA